MNTQTVGLTLAPTRRVGLLSRLGRWLWATQPARTSRRMASHAALRSALRFYVRRGRVRGLTEEQIVEEVATAMYERALAHGGGEADLGFFGPSLFRRDAERFVAGDSAVALRTGQRPDGGDAPDPRDP